MQKGESWKAYNTQKREKKSKLATRMRQISWANFMFL